MSEGPSLETLMMLGSMAPKSQEEGKPTVNVPLTDVEIRALAVLSNIRCQMLMNGTGEEAQQMFAIYLNITSKLMMAGMQASFMGSGDTQQEEHADRTEDKSNGTG